MKISKTIGFVVLFIGIFDFYSSRYVGINITPFLPPGLAKISPILFGILGILIIFSSSENGIRSYIKFADTLSTSMGKAFSWCIVILMGGTVYEVVMAYVFNKPTLWNFDFSMQMYGAILMMSGAYCLATEAHVRGDVIYRLFKQRTQAWIDLVLYFIFFFPGVVALAFYGYEYAAIAWKIKETSWSSPAQIQIYMVKSMIPAAGTLLIIQGIAEVFRSIICIKTGQWPMRMVVAEETEQMLMRTSQEEDKSNVI